MPRTTKTRSLDELVMRENALTVEIANIAARLEAEPERAAGHQEALHRAEAGLENVREEKTRAEHAERERADQLEHLDRIAQNPAHVENARTLAENAPQRTQTREAGGPLGHVRSEALRAIETHAKVSDTGAMDRVDRVIRRDQTGLEAEYIAAVADPAYERAFGLILADQASAHLRMSAEEHAAVRRVHDVERLRAMSVGTGAAGGFAVPYQLDPTLILTSNGALNPLRDLANVVTATSNEYRALTTAGVVASYDAEGSEVSDDSPTLAQPAILTNRGSAFVPFSIELDQDWSAGAPELTRLMADAKDVLDANKFIVGTGTGEPAGIITGLTTTQRVQTATVATFVAGDVYALIQAIPARFRPGSAMLANPVIYDVVFRMVGGASTEPALLPTRDGALLGLPKAESTTLVSTTTTGSKIAVAGDFKQAFTIVDRLGMQVELIQHLFGASGRPTGQRGLFAIWRTGSGVVNPAALRYLEVK